MAKPDYDNVEIGLAFREFDRQATVANFKVACVLGMLLMPAGFILDIFVYPEMAWKFLQLRFLCSLLIGIFLAVLLTPYGRKHYRPLGVVLFLLPASFIAWMIYATDGASSPYYAGLNLVLLVLAFVLHWTFWESFSAAALVVVLYATAVVAQGGLLHAANGTIGQFANNFYFLSLTAIIVVTGSFFHGKTRFREFAFRHQLDKSKHELEETNRKLVELDALKTHFFANISHELRTPLTLMLSPLETLMRRFSESADAKTVELLETMHGSGLKLLKLINDLLALIRLEAGRMEAKSEPLEISAFVRGFASAVRQVAEDKHIQLETHADAELGVVLMDREKLEKIVLNLLFNALKFTPEGGRVLLRAEKQGAELVLIVQDTGVGIAEKSLPFVFNRFWQEDGSSKRKYQGVGIGLALVKELATMMNGSVAVASEEGKGATFTVRLPYQKAVLSPVPPEPDVTAPANGAAASEEWLTNLYRRAEFFPAIAASRKRAVPMEARGQRPVVLVVDDEPDMRRFLRAELEDLYDVIEAGDGMQATEKAEQFLPDIILLDMMMPMKDGLEVCRELRQREATVKIPIILLTARADEETKFNALQMGANDFLAKPFSSIELHARIRNLVDSHHYQQKLNKKNEDLTSAIEQIKETEMQLVQSEKLASLGRLSAGIIHEINNPLNFTMTGLYTLRNKGKQLAPEARQEYEEILNDMEEGLKRVRNIVSDLRTFTHPGGGTGEPVDAADVANASLRFLAGEWKDKVVIHQNLPADLIIWANRNKLIHVLVNLIQNAIDALGEKKFAEGEQATIWIEGQVDGNRGLIVVRDNGMGIATKALDKIFDPFFTTKDVGKGMGLGLSICYRIVQGYGGEISVRSERGQFCEFTLNFPVKDTSTEETQMIHHGEPLRL